MRRYDTPVAGPLKALRFEANLSREAVARRLNVSTTTVRSWELGLSDPSASQVKALAELFKVSSDRLLGLAH